MKWCAFLIPAALLFACSDPVTVIVPAPHDATNAVLVFDGKDTLAFHGAVDSIRLSPSAEHTCAFVDGRKLAFHVGDGPGLLNTDSSAYVVFSVDYQAAGSDPHGPQIIVGYVVVDSFLVYRKPFANDQLTDSMAAHIASKVREKGNYAVAITPFGRKPLSTYASSNMVAGVRAIPAGRPFVERFWNIDLGHEVPKSITGQVQEGMEHIDTERRLTCILPARTFLLLAMSNREQYQVIDLRRAGRPQDGAGGDSTAVQ